MWWILVSIAVTALVSAIFSRQIDTANMMTKIAAAHPEKMKPLLVEEFPEHKDIFTTSFCSVFWTTTLAFALEKTKKRDDAEAIAAFAEMYERDKRNLEEEYFQFVKVHLPQPFLRDLENNQSQRDRLYRAMNRASTQAGADLD